MAVCPRCGSSNFKYELRSAGTRSKTKYYRTGVKNSWIVPAGRKTYQSNRLQKSVGVCPDCGYVEQTQEKDFWWYLVCLAFFPITLSVLFYRTSIIQMDKKWRAVILAVFWVGTISLGAYTSYKETDVSGIWRVDSTPLSDFGYYIDGNEITLKDYKGSSSRVNIAPEYEVDGNTYKVVALDGSFALENVKSVVVPEGVHYIANNTFNSCGIEYLYLPSTLEEFKGWDYFYDMQKLYFGGSEERFGKICDYERSRIDIVQIICNADINDIIVKKNTK